MNIDSERLCHLCTTNVGDGVQSEAVGRVVELFEVLANRVDHQSHQVRVLVHEQRERQVALKDQAGQAQHREQKLRPGFRPTICFSEYFWLEMRLTASMWPMSTWYPRMYVKTICDIDSVIAQQSWR